MTRPRLTQRIATLALAALAAASGAARGDFMVVSTPTAAYQVATSKVSITGANGTVYNALSDGTLNITLSGPTTVTAVGPGIFGWGNPPTVESNAPTVLFSQSQLSRTLTFDQSLSTFGVEMESSNSTNPFTNPSFTLTATFFDGATVVGTISQSLRAPGGARLFAASTTTDPFTSVTLTSSSGSGGFDFGQVRYTLAPVPELSSLTLLGTGALVVGFAATCSRRRARR